MCVLYVALFCFVLTITGTIFLPLFASVILNQLQRSELALPSLLTLISGKMHDDRTHSGGQEVYTI